MTNKEKKDAIANQVVTLMLIHLDTVDRIEDFAGATLKSIDMLRKTLELNLRLTTEAATPMDMTSKITTSVQKYLLEWSKVAQKEMDNLEELQSKVVALHTAYKAFREGNSNG